MFDKKMMSKIIDNINSNPQVINDLTKGMDMKQDLISMMTEKWYGKDFTDIDEFDGMADDVMEVMLKFGTAYSLNLNNIINSEK
tara:strand:- start:399 stop:650 length:252 start_codon:yes stop_codon:yes gene_type:complete